ncbi:hypothetical protein [Nocardia sp. NPDC003963]
MAGIRLFALVVDSDDQARRARSLLLTLAVCGVLVVAGTAAALAALALIPGVSAPLATLVLAATTRSVLGRRRASGV